MSQVVNEVESGQSSVEESMATDMTVVGGNVSDFVSKEPQSAPPSYFETDATIMNQDMSQVVNEVESGQSSGRRIDGDRHDGGGRKCIGLCVQKSHKVRRRVILKQMQR